MAEPARRFGPLARMRLDAAARLLQAPVKGAGGRGMVIQVRADETWHEAVLRTIDGLPESDRTGLKGLVDWIQDYGFEDEQPGQVSRAPKPKIPSDFEEAPLVHEVPDAPASVDDVPLSDMYVPDFDEEAELMAMASIESCRP